MYNNIMHKKQGFTLIELLVVVAIIGLLSSVVLAVMSSARAKGRDAAIKQSALEFRKLMALEYSNSGSYANLKEAGWITTSAGCAASTPIYGGTHSANAIAICQNIVRLGSILSTGGGNNNEFSIMVRLSSQPTHYFCIGSSGSTYQGVQNPGAGNWEGAGCANNP